MNKNALIGLAGGLLISAAVGGGLRFITYRSDSETQAKVTDVSPIARTTVATAGDGGAIPTTDRRVLYWHDPMVPSTKFDKPGKSPFMDMQLVPVYADEAGGESNVSISPRTVQNLGIRTATVSQGSTDSGFAAVGAVSLDERTLTTVQSRVNGYVEKLYVRAQYDGVKRGQPLAEIYSPDWLSAQEEYLTLRRSNLPAVESLLQAARERMLLLGISENQIAGIERNGHADRRVTLYAPEGGIVWELGVREGQAVGPGVTLFKLASLGTVWVNAEVPETQASLVKPGTPVEGRTAAMPEKVFKGQVTGLLPDVNLTTRTIKARIVLANPDRALQPGMFATLNFQGAGKQALMVPTEAVIYTGTRKLVIIAEGEGKFRPVDVQVGRTSGDRIEILKGLESGQYVVASGQFLIDSEASLKGVVTRLNDPGSDASTTAAPKPGAFESAASQTHQSRGKVIAIAGNRVTIQHGPIPSANLDGQSRQFWAPKRGLPSNVEVGDTVSFEFVANKAGEFDLTAITPEASLSATASGSETAEEKKR